jgi:hypothetical protein
VAASGQVIADSFAACKSLKSLFAEVSRV